MVFLVLICYHFANLLGLYIVFLQTLFIRVFYL